MQHNDDIAFQRAILANPSETTLKLVYADWLQERSDPRAEFIRAQVGNRALPEGEFDPAWIAFMTSLAQPFEPSWLCSKGDPFDDRVGTRGKVNVFESQYCEAGELTEGLLADLAFLMSVDWGYAPAGVFLADIHSFVCDLGTDNAPLMATDIRTALGNPPKGRLTQQFREQDMFVNWDPFNSGKENSGPQGQLKRYVKDGQLWYFATRLDHQPDSARRYDGFEVSLAVGLSPRGKRLVGALTYQLFGDT
jgi:uncharacterized protein (TIGR02996 family)